MDQFEFIKYEPTPGEKQEGIAFIKAYNRIMLRFKIVKTKDGKAFFPACSSYKMGTQNGEDIYLAAFIIDSKSEDEELRNLIRLKVAPFLNDKSNIEPMPVPKYPSNAPREAYQEELPF
jgi:hypothetical protein